MNQKTKNLAARRFEALLRADFRPFLEKAFNTLSPGQIFIPLGILVPPPAAIHSRRAGANEKGTQLRSTFFAPASCLRRSAVNVLEPANFPCEIMTRVPRCDFCLRFAKGGGPLQRHTLLRVVPAGAEGEGGRHNASQNTGVRWS
jgi:hypothetical protein